MKVVHPVENDSEYCQIEKKKEIRLPSFTEFITHYVSFMKDRFDICSVVTSVEHSPYFVHV